MHRFSDRAGSAVRLALTPPAMWPSVAVTTSAPRNSDFAAQYPACTYPCQRFAAPSRVANT